ncbi:alkyl hydroperoxide reductase [Bacillus sp. T33-2]|nr:alkyl hydroperoxide reductase [Bacillus sp. T33-2]
MAAVAAIYPFIKAMDAELLAISTDSVYSHVVFKETSPSLKHVTYPMLSDRNHGISKAYRVLDSSTGASYRASFFINPGQIIKAKLVYAAEVGRNIPEHLRILQGFHHAEQTGQDVPANWVPGQPGISQDPSKIGTI